MTDIVSLRCNFDEFIKTLFILSEPAEKQLEIMSFGDEMAIDFGLYYSDYANQYLENNLIDKNQKEWIDKIENFFCHRGGKDEYLDFWLDPNQLRTNSDWEQVRKMAKESLKVLNKSHLKLKVCIESENIDGLTVQILKRKLVDKYD